MIVPPRSQRIRRNTLLWHAALKKGCDGGDVRSCLNLDGMTLDGIGTKAHPAAATARPTRLSKHQPGES